MGSSTGSGRAAGGGAVRDPALRTVERPPDPGRRAASPVLGRAVRALAVALGPLVVLAGCSAEVALEAPSPSPQDARACAALTADLPATVAGQAARDVAGTEQAPSLLAAWGTPPITLRCGVVAPPSLTATSQCYEVDGVGWFAEQAPDGFLFTTIGRQVFVEVGVPSRYAPEADVLIELAAPVTDHDPVLQPCV